MLKNVSISTPVLYIVSCVIMVLLFAVGYLRLPPQIPLFYSLPNGTDQVVDVWLIVIVPIVSLLCLLLNTFLTTRLIERSEFLDNIARITNITIIIMTTYIFIKIIYIVTW